MDLPVDCMYQPPAETTFRIEKDNGEAEWAAELSREADFEPIWTWRGDTV